MLEVRPRKSGRRRASERPSSGTKFAGRSKWTLYVLYLAAAGLLLAGGFAVYTVIPVDNTNQIVMSVGRGFVRDAIREDLKANFSDDEETRVERLPNKKFLVDGWVDVVSEAGGTERNTFSCIVYKDDADNWVGEKVAVIPQHM